MQLTGIYRVVVILFNSLFPSCVLVTVCAVSLFLFFENLSLGENKFINTLAATTFGIYLLHDSNFVRYFLWCNVVKTQSLYNSIYFPLLTIISCLGIFIVCSLFDLLRLLVIEPNFIRVFDRIAAEIKKKAFIEE